jgi:hypothetical protein
MTVFLWEHSNCAARSRQAWAFWSRYCFIDCAANSLGLESYAARREHLWIVDNSFWSASLAMAVS